MILLNEKRNLYLNFNNCRSFAEVCVYKIHKSLLYENGRLEENSYDANKYRAMLNNLILITTSSIFDKAFHV